MSTSFKDYIETYQGTGGFQVFCETKDEDISLLETLTEIYGFRDERGVRDVVVNADPDDYPRQEFFVLRKDEDNVEYYLLDGFTRRRTRENPYDAEECPPFDLEEVMSYYGDTSDCTPDKNITSDDIFELM